MSEVARRGVVIGLVLGLGALAVPASGQAPPGQGVARVAVLSGATTSPSFERGFLEALSEAGWVQGRNLAYEVRVADGRYERLPGLAAELLRGQPQVPVAVVTNPDNPGALPVLEAIRDAAPKLAISVYHAGARTLEELDEVIVGLPRERADAILLGPEALVITHRQRVIDAAASRGIPVAGANTVFSESGALLSYSPHGASITRATARYVDKLLRGARPADLPVEQPTRLELIVNQKTARALGLSVPSTLLLRADRVIQ